MASISKHMYLPQSFRPLYNILSPSIIHARSGGMKYLGSSHSLLPKALREIINTIRDEICYPHKKKK